MTKHSCRFCGATLQRTFANLGKSPLANSFLTSDGLDRMEPFYPLHARVCESCMLVQLPEFESAEQIFGDYLYYSSFSDTWLAHCRAYAHKMMDRFHLGADSLVVEVASNDGYLLQYFKKSGIEVLGVEPAANIAPTAEAKGIPTDVAFFGTETAHRLAARGKTADLIAANNVLAHVPDLNDFVAGFKILLKAEGTATFEFPHLLKLIEQQQFDTIYHEHFSYFSLLTAQHIFSKHGLTAYDVEQLPTHGGSLRLYVTHAERDVIASDELKTVLADERAAGLDQVEGYVGFSEKIATIKTDLLAFLIEQRRVGKTVVGYGAAAKANTLLNYCGVGPELIPYVVDVSPHKQGRYLPGVQIPIYSPEQILIDKPDYILVLPWNIKAEIMDKMRGIKNYGGRFVIAIPKLTVLP